MKKYDGSEIVSVFTCNGLHEAHLLKGRLNNEDIPCFLTNTSFTQLMPHYNDIMDSGIQIMVRLSDYDKARELLQDKIAPDNNNIICPYCGSQDIGLGFGKKPNT